MHLLQTTTDQVKQEIYSHDCFAHTQTQTDSHTQTDTDRQPHADSHTQTATRRQTHADRHTQTDTRRQPHADRHTQTDTRRRDGQQNLKTIKDNLTTFQGRFFKIHDISPALEHKLVLFYDIKLVNIFIHIIGKVL